MANRQHLDVQVLVQEITKRLPEFLQHSGHDSFHAVRVYNNAMKLCDSEKQSNTLIVALSALLHDLGHQTKHYSVSDNHEQESSRYAMQILTEYNIEPSIISAVEYAISVHRASKGIVPSTIEARILQDADRLDALGAIVIARTFSYDSTRPIYNPDLPPKAVYDGISATSVNHLCEKVLALRPETFHTEAARIIAKSRHEFVDAFINEFLSEWNGQA